MDWNKNCTGVELWDVIMDVKLKFEKKQQFWCHWRSKFAFFYWFCTSALPQCSTAALPAINSTGSENSITLVHASNHIQSTVKCSHITALTMHHVQINESKQTCSNCKTAAAGITRGLGDILWARSRGRQSHSRFVCSRHCLQAWSKLCDVHRCSRSW